MKNIYYSAVIFLFIFTCVSIVHATDNESVINDVKQEKTNNSFLTNVKEKMYGMPIFAGYHSTSEQKREAQEEIIRLEQKKAEIENTLQTNTKLSYKEKFDLRRELRAIERNINEQKIITGQKWTTTRKSMWTAAGLSLGAGLSYKKLSTSSSILPVLGPNVPPSPPVGGSPVPPLGRAVVPVAPLQTQLGQVQLKGPLVAQKNVSFAPLEPNTIFLYKRQERTGKSVWIIANTRDSKKSRLIKFELWKIQEMSLFAHVLKGKPNNYSIEAQVNITVEELELLNSAFDTLGSDIELIPGGYQDGKISAFGKNIDLFDLSIVSQKVGANLLYATCQTLLYPVEMQFLMYQGIIPFVANCVGQKNMSCNEIFDSAGIIMHPMALCDENNLVIVTFQKIYKLLSDGTTQDLFNVNGKIFASAVSANGKFVVLYDEHDNLIVGNIHNNKVIFTSNAYRDIRKIAISSDGKIVAICENQTQGIVLLNVEKNIPKYINLENIIFLEFSQDDKRLLIGTYSKAEQCSSLYMVDIEGNKILLDSSISDKSDDPLSSAFSPDGKKLVLGYRGNKSLKIMDIDDKTKFIELNASGTDRFLSVAFSKDSNCIVTSVDSHSNEDKLIIWDVKTGSKIYIFKNPDKWLQSYTDQIIVDLEHHSIWARYVNGKILLWKFPFDLIKKIETELTIAQAQLLYEMYLSQQKGEEVFIINHHSLCYKIYETCEKSVKDIIHSTFNVQVR